MQKTEHEQRESFAIELADILYRQTLTVKCNSQFDLEFLDDSRAAEIFLAIMEDDESNLQLLKTLVYAQGIDSKPRAAVVQLGELASTLLSKPETSAFDKFATFMLLKQSQRTSAHLIHKALQQSAPDFRKSLGEFDIFYATLSRHVGQLAAIFEKLGVSQILGDENFGSPHNHSSVGESQSVQTQSDILQLLAKDHRKVESLFKAIENAPEQQEAAEFFAELKSDLAMHTEAEEETVYTRLQGNPQLKEFLDHSWNEHEEIRILLDGLEQVKNDKESFLTRLEALRNVVKHHVTAEESDVFPFVRRQFSKEVLMDLASEFKLAKQSLQDNSDLSKDSPLGGDPLRAIRAEGNVNH